MASNGNNELNDESCDSYMSDDSRERDFDFDYDDLVHNLYELELLDEDSDIDTGELKLMNETYVADDGNTSISSKNKLQFQSLEAFLQKKF
jgi:hypothetical protein